MKKLIKESTVFDKALFFTYIIALIICLILKASILSIIMAFLSLFGGQLNAKHIKIALLFLGAASIIYAIIAYNNHLLGEAIINVFYIAPMYFVNFFRKSHAKSIEENKELNNINHVKKSFYIAIVPCALIFTFLYGKLLDAMGGIEILSYVIASVNMPFLSALNTFLLIIAVYLTSRKYLEQWYIWLAICILMMTMWILAVINGGSNDYALIMQNFIYIIINSFGLINWKKIDKNNTISDNIEFPIHETNTNEK